MSAFTDISEVVTPEMFKAHDIGQAASNFNSLEVYKISEQLELHSVFSFSVSSSKLLKCMQKVTDYPLWYGSFFTTFLKIHIPQLSHQPYFSLISLYVKHLCQLRLITTIF